jgi:hypothetical protein
MHGGERDLIRVNSGLRNTHRAERCFILGNGPSLNMDDLSVLENETLFTVNNLQAADLPGRLLPRYHVVADRRFFSVDPQLTEDLAMFTTLQTIFTSASAPRCFVPSSVAGFIQSHQFDAGSNVSYICEPFYFTDFYTTTNDLTTVIPRFSSVVQRAILIATYLGFLEIYLLGCDATNIVANINSALRKSVKDEYAYEVPPELNSWLERQFAKRTMERCAEAYLEVLIGYRFLYDYCRAVGVKLVNCSSQTVIQSIPRKPLRNVL